MERTKVAAACILSVMLLWGCRSEVPRVVPGGEPDRGRTLIRSYGCHSCHTVPGVSGANALVGPPLIHWRRRVYIAGRVPNSPDALVQWIMDPRTVDPLTAMPDMGVSEADARDIAAYLFTLD